jgi:hypothetical protein
MNHRRRWIAAAAVAGLFLASPARSDVQEAHATGQNVVPVFEGWLKNADGTYTMRFGYFNRNFEEMLDIPVGPDNNFSPPPADRNQPTHFYLRRQQFMFDVVVPADWGDKDLVWTLTAHGRTDKAYATLKPMYELSDAVIAENRVGGMGRYAGEANQPPIVNVDGSGQRTVTLPGTVTLTVTASDDGFPTTIRERIARRKAAQANQPSTPRSGRRATQVVTTDADGNLGISWTHYRGAGTVTFEPVHPLLSGGKATTDVKFSAPGVYVLRVYADDGILTAHRDVTITVNSGSRQ